MSNVFALAFLLQSIIHSSVKEKPGKINVTAPIRGFYNHDVVSIYRSAPLPTLQFLSQTPLSQHIDSKFCFLLSASCTLYSAHLTKER